MESYIKTNEVLNSFSSICLSQMENVKLMNRVDEKFIIPIHKIDAILEAAKNQYDILEINEVRMLPYESIYYDTINMDLYYSHMRGRVNRYKIRLRNYLNSNLSYLEIKFKNNKGRTIKSRIESEYSPEVINTQENASFINSVAKLNASDLQSTVSVTYKRVTLINKFDAERTTLDFDLAFTNNDKEKKYSKFVIIEVKQDKLKKSPIKDIIKAEGIREGSISKYCMGIICLDNTIKQNTFKHKMLKINNLTNQYERVS